MDRLIETQNSASPYHDWNERVYAECYRPNAYSRLLDPHGAIIDIHNNYAMMSFNFGPTLFSWLEQYHCRTVQHIIEPTRQAAPGSKVTGMRLRRFSIISSCRLPPAATSYPDPVGQPFFSGAVQP